MATTRRSVLTALLLALMSLLLFLGRWSLAGPDPQPAAPEDGGPRGVVDAVSQVLSLTALRHPEQKLVTFLLLLPLAALVVSVYRVVIGVPTFGTFTPALLGVVFLDWKALPWGLGIVFLTVMLGWGLRHALDRYHLLMVPRMAILLTFIVTFLIVFVATTSRLGMPIAPFITLLPLVILTHMVERFGTIEADEGTPASFKALLGTFLVAGTISLALGPDVVARTLLGYPELVGVVIAAQFLLGRYTGYRLTELYRFQDLMPNGPAAGGRS